MVSIADKNRSDRIANDCGRNDYFIFERLFCEPEPACCTRGSRA